MRCSTHSFIVLFATYVAAGAFNTPVLGPPCQWTLIPSPSPKLHCEQYGTLDQAKVQVLKQSSTSSEQLCRNACLARRRCISYSYDTQSLSCTFYSRSLIKQGFKRDATSTVIVANRHCFTCRTGGRCMTNDQQIVSQTDFDPGNQPSAWTFNASSGQPLGYISSDPSQAYIGTNSAVLAVDGGNGTAVYSDVEQYITPVQSSPTLYLTWTFKITQTISTGKFCQLQPAGFTGQDWQGIDSYVLTGNEDPTQWITRTSLVLSGYAVTDFRVQLSCYDPEMYIEVVIGEASMSTVETNCPFTLSVLPQTAGIKSPGYLTNSTNGQGKPIAVTTNDITAAYEMILDGSGLLLNQYSRSTASAYVLAGSSTQVYFDGPSFEDNYAPITLSVNRVIANMPSLDAGTGSSFAYCPSSAGSMVGLQFLNSDQSLPNPACYYAYVGVQFYAASSSSG